MAVMNVSQFVAKWRKSKLNERAGSQEHFIDLCHVFDHPTPGESSPDDFVFERAVAKASGRPGRADVWKRGYFAWEYKSKGKDLNAAHDQLRQYRESLLSPPLLVACDMGILDVRTNFTRKETKRHEIVLDDLGSTHHRAIVENIFWNPDQLEPGEDGRLETITDKAAGDLADIARRMRARGVDPSQVALFLDRVVFCLFAQDVRILGDRVFTKIIEKTHRDPQKVSAQIFKLFDTMNLGGDYGLEEIPHFNGDLFASVRPLELTSFEVDAIHKVARLNWGEVDASIFGTLFERGLDPAKEAEIGTHYTRREDISAIVEPVVMEPLRREWKAVRDGVEDLFGDETDLFGAKIRAKSPKRDPIRLRKARAAIRDFHQRLQDVTILDPACGSGNFLYVTLQKLKDLEKEVLVYASQRNIDEFMPMVGPWQLRGIEKSPYAYDLARMTIWIGWLQWTKVNGFGVDWRPILRTLDNLRKADAILNTDDPIRPVEPEWPDAEFIVGNPPFLGGKKLKAELTDRYVDSLFSVWGTRVRPEADLCCYWFEKARQQIASGRSKRAGLLATQGIRGGASRETLMRIKESGDIFFAASDMDWVLSGASVHVSMIGFDDGSQTDRILDDRVVPAIHADLSSATDITSSRPLGDNLGLAFMGDTKGGKFEVAESVAAEWMDSPNVNCRPNSDLLIPWINGLDITRRNRRMWIIDFGAMPMDQAARYAEPFERASKVVLPERMTNKRQAYRERWWIHVETRPSMKRSLASLSRFLVTPRVAKHRLFTWIESPTLPDCQVIAFARDDDYTFGILHSRAHQVWALRLGTRLETRPRYTPTTCFETFPFPEPFAGLESVIGGAARDLNAARESWLNPIEWTRDDVLEFQGSTSGPWARFVVDADESGVGTVRYVRRAPKNNACASKLVVRTLTNLYNDRPTWLDLAHRKLDEAVFAAYGWKTDISDDEIVARLLTLNLERAKAEDATRQPGDSDPRPHVGRLIGRDN